MFKIQLSFNKSSYFTVAALTIQFRDFKFYFMVSDMDSDSVKAILIFTSHSNFISSLEFCSLFCLDVTDINVLNLDAIVFYDSIDFLIFRGSPSFQQASLCIVF